MISLVVGLLISLVTGCNSNPNPKAEGPATPCEVCHAEVELGFNKTRHAAVNHTCATCHGRSARHSWSEDGHVEPDRSLKARGPADRFCISCHKDVEHPRGLKIRHVRCTTCHKPHPKRHKPEPNAARSSQPTEPGALPQSPLAAVAISAELE